MTFSSGSNVSAWADKSGTGNNFTGSATYSLDSTFNNKFGLAFDGTNNFFLQSSSSVFSITNTTYCIFTAHHFTTASPPGALEVYRSSNYDYFFFRQVDTGVQFTTDTGGFITSNGTGAACSGIGCINTPTTSSATAYLNGTSIGTASRGTSTNVTFSIGESKDGLERLVGTIFEMIIFNNTLTDPQRQQVEQYLANKWGLVANLPSGHPGKLLPAFSTNFTVKSISGCVLWLDGADSSTITGTTSVTAWANKGTAGGSTSTTSGTVTSTSKINNLPVLSFSDSAYMTASTLTFTQNTRTAFVVVNIGESGVTRTDLNGSTSVDTQLYNYGNGYTDIEFNYSGHINYQKQNPSGIFNTTSIICGTLGTDGGIFVTGTSQAPNNINTPATFGTGTTTTQRVGGGGSFILGEAMIFDGAITAAQRQQVEGYLAWKWGLQSSLPSTHADAKFAP
jgi:hypothetical protein